MTSERDRLHLAYILDSIDLIVRYTSGGKRQFEQEVLLQDAVLRRLETLADATNKLPSGDEGPASAHPPA